MKKTLIAQITALLIVSTTSVAFAANPFSDVPKDHWSRSAIQELSAKGIIEGYEDSTYRGNQHITRYEMAMMVAKAMAKENLSAEDKQSIEKLSSEYADELKNLGVRVQTLEEKSDNVKFSGYMYLRAQSQDLEDKSTDTKTSTSLSRSFLDLFTTAKVNENWNAVMETNTLIDLKNAGDASTTIVGSFAEGKYDHLYVRLGRFDQYSGDGGLVLHGSVNGGEITFGNRLKTTLTAGNISNSAVLADNGAGNTFGYHAAEFAYPVSKATTVKAAYHHMNDDAFATKRGDTDPEIYTLGFNTKLNKDFKLTGYYLKSGSDQKNGQTVEDQGYYANLEYKGPKLGKTGSWGLYLKYADIPELTQISMDVGHFKDYKGFELGTFYMLTPNMRGHLRYYRGENVENSNKRKDLVRAEVRMFF